MIDTKHFNRLRSMYLNANVNTQIYDSTECTIEKGRAEISLVVSEKYFHALHAIHGSVYFKLLDDSAYFAAHSMVDDFFYWRLRLTQILHALSIMVKSQLSVHYDINQRTYFLLNQLFTTKKERKLLSVRDTLQKVKLHSLKISVTNENQGF